VNNDFNFIQVNIEVICKYTCFYFTTFTVADFETWGVSAK